MPYRFWVALLTPVLAMAQAAGPSPETRLANLEAAVKSAQSAGDNAWMLVSAALVLMMTGPGLALFYGGLVRRKNVLGTMMHSFILMAVVTVIWAIVGYSLAFGEGSPFIGDLRYLFLNSVGAAPNPDYAATIPQQTYMIYQLMFAIITPALISGAFAERMKFSAMLLFSVLWLFIVYFPLAHMVWGKGGLAERVLSAAEFPASISPAARWCISAPGVSALVCALYLGKRKGYHVGADEAAQPGAQRHRRVPAVGGLVRIQRGQRAGRVASGHQRVRRHALRHRRRRARLAAGGVDPQRQAERVGRNLGRRRGPGRHHAGLRIREAVSRAADRFRRRRRLLLHGHRGEEQVRLRRYAGRIRSPRRGRHHRRAFSPASSPPARSMTA